MIPALDIFVTFAKIGLFSFGSATSEVILEQVVEKRKWLSKEAFLENLSLAALVPGPFHVNLVAMLGYSLAGATGGIMSVAAFVFPGLAIAIGVAAAVSLEPVRVFLNENPGIVAGMLAAVAGLLLNVIVNLAKTAVSRPAPGALVAGLAVVLFYFKVHFAVAVLSLGLAFVIFSLRKPRRGNPS